MGLFVNQHFSSRVLYCNTFSHICYVLWKSLTLDMDGLIDHCNTLVGMKVNVVENIEDNKKNGTLHYVEWSPY